MNGAGGSVFDELAQSVFGTLRQRFTLLEQANRELHAKLSEAEESKRRLEDDLRQRGAAIQAMQSGLQASAEQALGGLEESYQRIVEQQKAQQDQFEERLRSVHTSMENLFGLFQQEQAAILQQLTGDLSRDLADVSRKGQSDLSTAIDDVRSRFLNQVAALVDSPSPAVETEIQDREADVDDARAEEPEPVSDPRADVEKSEESAPAADEVGVEPRSISA